MSLAAKQAASLARPPVDLRRLLPGIRRQGPRPLCVPFAVTTAHEAARALLEGSAPAASLSVEPIWRLCLENGRAGHNGTTMPDAANALNERGHPDELSWPYDSTLGAGSEPDPDGVENTEWHCAHLLDVPLAHDGVEELIELALVAGFPVMLLIEVTVEFETPAGGEIDVPLIISPLGDYHAIVVAGAATSADGATRRFLVRNSWGPGWGAGGYGWMPVDYLIAFAVQAAVIDPGTLLTY